MATWNFMMRGKVQPQSVSNQPSAKQNSRYVRPASVVQTSTSMSRSSLLTMSIMAPIQIVQREPRMLIFVVVAVCFLWTLLLLVLTWSPNHTVNYIMRTENFDGSSFWRLVHPTDTVLILGIFGLWSVAVGFFALLMKIGKRKQSGPRQSDVISEYGALRANIVQVKLSTGAGKCEYLLSSFLQFSKTMGNIKLFGQVTRISMKFGDVILESVLLYEILEAGMPIPLVGMFTAITVANTVASAVFLTLSSEKYCPLVETLVYITFDFLVAIGYPMASLFYCIFTFNFDRELLKINLAIYPVGWYETVASVLADPEQTAVIHKVIRSLRIVSVLDFFARVGVNLLLCIRLHQVVGLFDDPTWQKKQPFKMANKYRYAIRTLFICIAVTLIVFVEESVRVSRLACEPHVECVVHAWRFTFLQQGSLTQCPCLTLIDREVAPRTYAEYLHPKNVTDKVAQLASTGDLQVVRLVNRYLPVLPAELRRCSLMRHLSLAYTHTETLPDWFKEFKNLEFLDIQGKSIRSLATLQEDLFDDMSLLTYIHLAGHTLRRFPSFDGLTSLKSLTLAVLLSLTELPPFDKLDNLERLHLSSMAGLTRLPDLTPVSDQLKSFVVSDRGTWCCNGFLGTCDLLNPLCGVHPLFGTPAATCLTEDFATTGTLTLTSKFSASICGEVLQPGTLEGAPTEASMSQCNGTLYRQCYEPGYSEAMCYNARSMGIACTPNKYPIAMRRRQIKEGVGIPCNSMYEAWLGCK